MNAQLDLGRVVTDWMHAEASASGSDRVLAATLVRVSTVRQERRRPTWKRPKMNTTFKLAVAAAAVVAVALAADYLLPARNESGGAPVVPSTRTLSPAVTPSPTPLPPGVGLIGLPAPGATPSTPERGVLLDEYLVHGGGMPFEGMVRLYADGRMIWYEFLGPQNAYSTGHLEQRLTSEGVQLVRTHPSLAEKDPHRLAEWLPSSAWEDQQLRPYVPQDFAACLEVFDPFAPIGERIYPRSGPPMDRSEILALLPAAAAEILRGQETLAPATDAHDCLILSIADARRLDEALRNGGLEQDEGQNRYVLQYHRDAPGPGTTRIVVTFEPRFPDGTIGCSACG